MSLLIVCAASPHAYSFSKRNSVIIHAKKEILTYVVLYHSAGENYNKHDFTILSKNEISPQVEWVYDNYYTLIHEWTA